MALLQRVSTTPQKQRPSLQSSFFLAGEFERCWAVKLDGLERCFPSSAIRQYGGTE